MPKIMFLTLCILAVQCKKPDQTQGSVASNNKVENQLSENTSDCFVPKSDLKLVAESIPNSLAIKNLNISDQFPYVLNIVSDSPYDIAKVTYCSESKDCKSGYTLTDRFEMYPELKSIYSVKVKICFEETCSIEAERKFTSQFMASEKAKAAYKKIETFSEEVLLAAEKRVAYEDLNRSYGPIYLRVLPYAINHPDRLFLAQDLCTGPIVPQPTEVVRTQTVIEIVKISKVESTDKLPTGAANSSEDSKNEAEEIKKDLKEIGQYFGATITFFATVLLGKKIYDIRQAKKDLIRSSAMENRIDAFVKKIKSNPEFGTDDYRPAIAKLEEIRAAYPDLFAASHQRVLDELKIAELDVDLKSKQFNALIAANPNGSKELLDNINNKNVHTKAMIERFGENKQSITSKYSTADVALGVGKYAAIIAASGAYTISGFFLADSRIQNEMAKLDWEIYKKLMLIEELRTHLPPN